MPPANVFQSCKACRHLKRKCSRDLPSCSLCVRLQRVCEYGAGKVSILNSNSSDIDSKPGLRQSNYQDIQNEAFPSSFFLDPDYFQPVSQHSLISKAPSFISDASLTANDNLLSIIDDYVSTIHTWLPMLSIKRLRQEAKLLGKTNESGITKLLFLSIKALMARNSTPHASPRSNSAYLAAKQYSFMAENGGFINIRLVQTLSLVAVYELGHGIYPAAYLTIGRAVRLATMIGLQSQIHAKQLFTGADTWTLCEEQRRTWWTVLMLDRLVVTGSPDLVMSAPEPGPDDLLPSNDIEWTQGKIGSNNALLTLDFHSPSSLGGFTYVCQAVHVLGKVLHHVQSRKTSRDILDMIQEALQLHKILESLDASLDAVAESSSTRELCDTENNYSALSICSLARLIVYNQYACNEPNAVISRGRVALEVEMQQLSLEGIKEIASKTLPDMARAVVSTANDGFQSSYSPIMAGCLYHAATECAWFVREDGDADMVTGLESIVSALQVLRLEWSVCENYLALLQMNYTSMDEGMESRSGL